MDRIKQKLYALKPHYCNIIDESYMHKDHKDGGIESHFKIQISKNVFKNNNLLKQHKMIYNLLADELANGLHALSIEII